MLTVSGVPQIQKLLAEKRVKDLKALRDTGDHSIQKKITLLEQYILHLEDDPETPSDGTDGVSRAYQIPSDTVSPDEWAEFDNVYQIHCPKISLDAAVRDVCMTMVYLLLSY